MFLALVLAPILLHPVTAAAALPANQLRDHPSPYLALHAADPVAWQLWTPATRARASAEGKLLLLSVGYFSCHWCHVMQRESFKDPAIAAFINRHFIPVKIDRELEPVLDEILTDFVQSTRGRAGWPLHVFLTPAGAPLYATLYLPPAEFVGVLERVAERWRTDRERLTALAEHALPQPKGPGDARLDAARAHEYERLLREAALARADIVQGGFGEASKFPSAPQLVSLLEQAATNGDEELQEFLKLTLDAMANNGLHDQVGGGFFRYTSDPAWNTPHFEKMLYDNAQLARIYLRASRLFARADYREIGLRTLDFMLREMWHPQGGFIAALSAVDERGVEGGYYLWDQTALGAVLNEEEEKVYRHAFGMTEAAAFDDGYLPLPALDAAATGAKLGIDAADVERQLASATRKLLAARADRKLPRDDKRIAGWNGLALMAVIDAVHLTGEPRYRSAANQLRNFLVNVAWDGRQLHRAAAQGRRIGRVAAEDYAYVGQALLAWAELTKAPADFRLANKVVQAGWRRYYVRKNGMPGWRASDEGVGVAQGRVDLLPDGALASPSTLLVDAALRLADRAEDDAGRLAALRALNAGAADVREDPFWFATHIALMRRTAGSR